MMNISSILTVDVGERSYPIDIGEGLLGEFDIGASLAGTVCVIVTNNTVGSSK